MIVFFAYQVLGGDRRTNSQSDVISVTRADLERMAALYASESGALPKGDDMGAMIADFVETKALAREAVRLGLDAEDTIIERRLAQKMRFMVQDLAEVGLPDDDVLRAYFEANVEKYAAHPSFTFEQIYYRAENAAQISSDLALLNGRNSPDWRDLGDPLMLQRQYGDLPDREVVRLFGADFLEGLMALSPAEAWQGPVPSAFGQHIVRLRTANGAAVPAFAAVRDKVLSDWRDEEMRKKNSEAIAEIVSKYRVKIEGEGSK